MAPVSTSAEAYEDRLQRCLELIREDDYRSTEALGRRLGVARYTAAEYLRELKKRGDLPRSYQPPTVAQEQARQRLHDNRRAILRGIAEGKTFKQIAEELGVKYTAIQYDVNAMRDAGAEDYLQAEEKAEQVREQQRRERGLGKTERITRRANKMSAALYGLSLKHLNQVNIAGFHREELLSILKGEARLTDLEANVVTPLKSHGLVERSGREGQHIVYRLTWDAMAALFTAGAVNPEPIGGRLVE